MMKEIFQFMADCFLGAFAVIVCMGWLTYVS